MQIHPSYQEWENQLKQSGFHIRSDKEIQDTKFTREEVSKHKSLDDLYVIFKGKVYDATLFVNQNHIGGTGCFIDDFDQDIEQNAELVHPQVDIAQHMRIVCIGTLQ